MSPEITRSAIIITIAGMALVNFTVRFLPIAILSRIDLPDPIRRWLSFVPISVMGSLVATEVLMARGRLRPDLIGPGPVAALITMLVFHRSRSFLGATLAGMISFVALRAVL